LRNESKTVLSKKVPRVENKFKKSRVLSDVQNMLKTIISVAEADERSCTYLFAQSIANLQQTRQKANNNSKYTTKMEE